MDAKYLLAKLRAGQLLQAEQGRAAEVLWELMITTGQIEPDSPLRRRPSTAPVDNSGALWCDCCQCYHSISAEHIGTTYDGYTYPKS